MEKISKNSCFRLHIYLHTNKTLIHNSLRVFDSWRRNLRHDICSTIAVRKCLPESQADPDNQRPVQWRFTVL
jgi:hypothetical protein